MVAGLTQELARQGEQVDVLTMHYRNLPYIRKTNGVNVFGVPCIRNRKEICTPFEMGTYLLNAYPIARKLIHQNGYDLLHAHFIFPDGVLAYRLYHAIKIPYLVTAHGSDVPGYNPHRFRLEHRLLLPLWRNIVQSASFIVTASDNLANLIQRHLPNQQIERIYNAITPPPLTTERKDPLHILVVSRLFERKGIQYLIQALDGDSTPYRVDIIGDGPYQAELNRLVRTINTNAKITFHGWLEQEGTRFWQLMQSAAIFVFPSEAENFPMVLLEAMAASMAIITTNNSGCAEVVGDAAILVPPKNAKAIRAALIQFRNNPQKINELGKRARERMENLFTWQIMAESYRWLYQKMIIVNQAIHGQPEISSTSLP